MAQNSIRDQHKLFFRKENKRVIEHICIDLKQNWKAFSNTGKCCICAPRLIFAVQQRISSYHNMWDATLLEDARLFCGVDVEILLTLLNMSFPNLNWSQLRAYWTNFGDPLAGFFRVHEVVFFILNDATTKIKYIELLISKIDPRNSIYRIVNVYVKLYRVMDIFLYPNFDNIFPIW